MKWCLSILTILAFRLCIVAQELPPVTEQQLENLTAAAQSEMEDDSYLQQLEAFRKNPVDLNSADENELKELQIITDLQIQNLLSYRKLLGNLLNIYELQAVPSWDLATIRKIIPFVKVSSAASLHEDIGLRLRKGDHVVLLRISQTLEPAAGFKSIPTGPEYAGSPYKIFFRHRYSYKNLLQFGVVAEKDAGEQFFKGAQRAGFDFYSFHVFAKKIGLVEAIALGDFTVNLGQGLIQWQSLGFKKSADVINIKRQSVVLRPYNSAGEYNFHRGVGITLKKGKVETTIFGSYRKLNANFIIDTTPGRSFVTSFLTSGNNRSKAEIADKNKLTELSAGGNIKYRGDHWHVALNGIYFHFSTPLRKADEPYNLYALNGDQWFNFSVDYSYTFRNIHWFGEAAADRNLNKAFVNGLLISVDPKIDMAILHRNIGKAYNAINANAFTENSSTTNENGLYAGITLRPGSTWHIDTYADIFYFPWLKYLVDAPGQGKDFVVQLAYAPNKQFEIYTRYRNETKQANAPGSLGPTHTLVELPKQNWRIHLSYKLNSAVTLRNRIEMLRYRNNSSENGFLTYFDFVYRPLIKPYSALLRLQHFETDGFNARLYAYENDVLYGYSIPVFFDKGFRYYFILNYDFTKNLSIWLRWAQTVYQDKDKIGSGYDQINGNRKTEARLQLRYIF